MTGPATPDEVIAFWRDAGPDRWFTRDDAFDELCRARFLPTYELAATGGLSDWEHSAEGVLALLILLDQLPRNMFRGSPQAWATDASARALADRAIDRRLDQAVEFNLRRFIYLPLMHAEDLAAQERSVALNSALGDPDIDRYARHHRDIIARFRRFPHRNTVLGRETTPEELTFLGEDQFRG